MEPIYLDYNATTPMVPEAWEAMRPFATEAFGNPASAHFAGRKARRALEDARERIAELLGAEPDEVIFTSGATEANNLAIFGLANEPCHVVASPIEHPCVVEPLRVLESRGWSVEWVRPTARGVVEADAVASRVRGETRFVSLMLVNHETGAIQPVREVAERLPREVAVHTDAAQAVGKIAVRFRELGVTALTASGHKFGGPKGIGVLLLRRGTAFRPLVYGGHQQRGQRPGTEPVPLAVGMAAALVHATRNLETRLARMRELRSWLFEQLQRVAAPVILNGPELGAADVAAGTLNVSFPGCRADLLVAALDLAGVACSTGSACSSGSLLPSPVLRAMGVPDEVLISSIRLSFGPEVDASTLEAAAGRIGQAVARLRRTH